MTDAPCLRQLLSPDPPSEKLAFAWRGRKGALPFSTPKKGTSSCFKHAMPRDHDTHKHPSSFTLTVFIWHACTKPAPSPSYPSGERPQSKLFAPPTATTATTARDSIAPGPLPPWLPSLRERRNFARKIARRGLTPSAGGYSRDFRPSKTSRFPPLVRQDCVKLPGIMTTTNRIKPRRPTRSTVFEVWNVILARLRLLPTPQLLRNIFLLSRA